MNKNDDPWDWPLDEKLASVAATLRTLGVLLALALVFFLSACGGGGDACEFVPVASPVAGQPPLYMAKCEGEEV